MKKIFYDDGVQPSTCVHTCNTIKEAVDWIGRQLKGHELIDTDYQSAENVLTSSKTAQYQVYDGDPVVIGENGEPTLVESIYVLNNQIIEILF